MSKHVVIAVGGSGGHVLPAEKIANLLKGKCEISYVGVGIEKNPYFLEKPEKAKSIAGGNFAKGKLRGMINIAKGVWQARKYLKKNQVGHVIGLGSYHSLPVLLAAKSLRIPFTIYEPNIFPGKVNRYLSRFAKGALIQFEPSSKFLKTKATLIDLDLSAETMLMDRKEARELLDLDPEKSVVLVFGGSQGADRIGEVFLEAIQRMKKPMQVIHFGGRSEFYERCYQELKISAFVRPFYPHMQIAWSACDFAICRAGAGTILEQFLYERPAILIPYPHAMDDHQKKNALYMENEAKGAIQIDQADFTSKWLADQMDNLLFSEQSKLNVLQQALKNWKEKCPRVKISQCLQEIL